MERSRLESDRVPGSAAARSPGRGRAVGGLVLVGLVGGVALLAGTCGDGEREPEVAVASSLSAFLEAADALPERTALLIGIDRYAPERGRPFADLEGCRNDVQLMKELIVEQFGFEERNVCVLLDEEATHRGIVEAFDRALVRRARDGTEVFFYLSGHGSQVPDLSGETRAEYDGRDSTYLAYDSRVGGHDGDRDLNDDELRCLLTALVGKGARVTAVTDSCHSGEILRGSSRARAAPAGASPLDRKWVEEFWPEGVGTLHDDAVERVAPDEGYVHIAAAERDERAWECEIEGLDGESRTHGALTYVLANAMRNAPAHATWRTIIDDVAIRVASLKSQTVNARGIVDRLLFGGDFAGARGHKSEWKSDGGFLLIHAGWLHGLRKGSVVEVRDALGEGVFGRATVVKYNAGFARAEWEGEAPGGALEGGLRAFERSRPAGEPPLRIFLEVPGLRPTLVAEPFAELVELVEEEKPADYRIFRDDAGGLRFETVEGLPLPSEFDALEGGSVTSELIGELEKALRATLRWRAVHLLASERGSIPVKARFRSATPDEVSGLRRKSQPVELVDGAHRVRGAPTDGRGQVGVFEIIHSHERVAHVYVFSIEEGGAINTIYPSGGGSNLVEPEKLLEVKVAFIAHSDWPFERPMRDRYLVIATDHLIDTGELEAEGALRSGATTPSILSQAFLATRSRGSTDVVPDGWGTAVIDILVMQPE